MSSAWIGAIAAIGSLLLAVTALVAQRAFSVAKWLWGVFKRIEQLIEDFNGASERPGVAARPGVLERLQAMDGDLATVKAELSYNSGSTLKDAVRRIDHNVADLAQKNNTQPQVAVNVHP